jgi:hypothetical protein
VEQQRQQRACCRAQQEQSQEQEQQQGVSDGVVGPRFVGPAILPEMRRDYGFAAEAGPPAVDAGGTMARLRPVRAPERGGRAQILRA